MLCVNDVVHIFLSKMANLYTDLSQIYEAMYQTFIDYDEEFDFYKGLLAKYKCRSVLEIGCGTGNLAHRFAKEGFVYAGLDMSEEMLRIARKNNPACEFIKGDMRNFTTTKEIDAVIITGRTISYLVSNEDVHRAFHAIGDLLKPAGILCFDSIDASKFIPSISKEPVTHRATHNGEKFLRESFWSQNPNETWTFDWRSVFYRTSPDGQTTRIGEDNSTIRSFTKDDMRLFLTLAGFETRELFDRPSYAFDTFVVVAEK